MTARSVPSSTPLVSESLGPVVPSVPTVLVVDDGLVDRHVAGGLIEEILGWKVVYAENGLTALEAVEREKPGLVLTDLQMPEMDGLQLVDAMRKQHPLVPVVLMTAHGSEEIALQALRQGAASYVPKKRLAADLGDTLEQVLESSQANSQDEQLKDCLMQLNSSYFLTNDMGLVRGLIAVVQRNLTTMKIGPGSSRIQMSIALHEALTNALFHGNLELSSDLRQNYKDQYWAMAEQRRRQHPYRDRVIEVQVKLSRREAIYEIRDQGPGFDTSQLADPTDIANLEKPSGRGLLLIRTFMDRVDFNPQGNGITLVKFWKPSSGNGQ